MLPRRVSHSTARHEILQNVLQHETKAGVIRMRELGNSYLKYELHGALERTTVISAIVSDANRLFPFVTYPNECQHFTCVEKYRDNLVIFFHAL